MSAEEKKKTADQMSKMADQMKKNAKSPEDMAKEAANKLAASAKSVGLAQAARTSGVTMITTGPISPRSPRAIQGYLLTDNTALQDLGKAATKLLEQASQEDPHPSTEFELPRCGALLCMYGERLSPADVANLERLLSACTFTHVLHLAAQVHKAIHIFLRRMFCVFLWKILCIPL